MPIVFSNRPHAQMNKESGGDASGSNKFVVDQIDSRVVNFNLGDILPDLSKHVQPTGCFELAALEKQATSRNPLFTMESQFVLQLRDAQLKCRVSLIGAEYHLMIKQAILPVIKDRKVRSLTNKYRFEAVASIIQKHGKLTARFVNANIKNDLEEFRGYGNGKVRVYTRRHPDAPKALVPYLYKVGIRMWSGN